MVGAHLVLNGAHSMINCAGEIKIARIRQQIARGKPKLRVFDDKLRGKSKLRAFDDKFSAQNKNQDTTNNQTKSQASGGIHLACSPAHFTLQPSGFVSGTDTSSPRTSSESTRSKSFTVTLAASFG